MEITVIWWAGQPVGVDMEITVIWWAGQPVGVDMEGVVNSESVPTSLIQVADSHRNIFLFRYRLSINLLI
jgi:hypothetical protein